MPRAKGKGKGVDAPESFPAATELTVEQNAPNWMVKHLHVRAIDQ